MRVFKLNKLPHSDGKVPNKPQLASSREERCCIAPVVFPKNAKSLISTESRGQRRLIRMTFPLLSQVTPSHPEEQGSVLTSQDDTWDEIKGAINFKAKASGANVVVRLLWRIFSLVAFVSYL